MSWFSRAGGGWGAGRFSPFGRSSNPNSNEVKDGDFSYITDQDLKDNKAGGRHRASSRADGAAKPQIVDWEDKNPDRETDVLVFKHAKTMYPTHFPAQSIRDGELSIGTVRAAAAKKMGIADPQRIRMFFKGRNLKHDERTAAEEGLRGDGTGSEILCVLGEAGQGGMAPGFPEQGGQRAWSDNDDEEDNTDGGEDDANAPAAKKKRSRRGGKKGKNKKKGDAGPSSPALGYSNATSTNPEFLPTPTNFPGARPAPSSAPISRAATPLTPIGKLDALASKFHTEFVPLCVQYLNNPPEDPAKRQFEYKKLSETILTQVLLKLDGVETEGDQEARSRRKELVREVNQMLSRLDEMNKGGQ